MTRFSDSLTAPWGRPTGREGRQAVGDVRLDADEVRVDAEDGAGEDAGEHGVSGQKNACR
jgi:hypothetical protein